MRPIRKQEEEEGPLHVKCDICGVVTSTKSFPSHMSKVHDITGSFNRKCHWCEKVLGYRSLKFHAIQIHFWGRFSCQKCGFLASFAYDIIIHVNKEHSDERDVHILCPSCNVSCHISEIETHYKECVTKQQQEIERLKTEKRRTVKVPAKESSQELGPLDIRCRICEKVIDGNNYKRHLRKVHGKIESVSRKCHWCEKILDVFNLKDHSMRFHHYGNFLCIKCGFKAPFAQDLISHVTDAHKDDKGLGAFCPSCKVKCPIGEIDHHYKECINLKFKKRSRLTHKYDTCNKVCDICGKMFKHKVNYNNHMKTHMRNKIANGDEDGINSDGLHHYCDKCGQKFNHPRSLKMHRLRVHENVKFPCPSCSMTFSSKLRCIQHQRAEHTTDKKYQCKHCPLRNGNLAHLRTHERTHEEPKFQCKYCPKKLSTEQTLVAHERQHTGEKPYKCSRCENAFASKHGLNQHMQGAHKIVGPRGGKPGWSRKQKL